jgi:hypothetical protein
MQVFWAFVIRKLFQKVVDVSMSMFSPLVHLLTPKGPRVFWCKTTQNYPLLKKELVILF